MPPDTLERSLPHLKDPTLLRQQCYVDGRWIDADGGATMPVKNGLSALVLVDSDEPFTLPPALRAVAGWHWNQWQWHWPWQVT